MIEIDEFKNLRKLQYEEEKTQVEKLKEQLDLFDASNLLRIVGTLILMAINLLYRDGFGFMILTMGSILMAAISVLLLDRLPGKDFEWAHDPEVDGNYYYANLTTMVTLVAVAGFEVWTTSRFAMTIIFFGAVIFCNGLFSYGFSRIKSVHKKMGYRNACSEFNVHCFNCRVDTCLYDALNLW